ncbi:uncharacterized protein LOC130392964 [Gadus chalcogrammus]|uniref:uncharacterized protein LOC130392964 n=1 Tax=Gadus chalcogrammus TaxID=1042646 RepID=UPI0024C4E1B9|nr:uncharacterized protein LOC130392964 [Gadus chalcogrammus]
MGHATAKDLLQHFKECVQQLDLRHLVSISMDGPNVNWKFFSMLQQEHADTFGGAQLIVVGSCGLHTLHNAFKSGFSVWQMEKVLRALHTLLHNTPARREDFCSLTKSSVFPLPFCGHRWIENLPVVDRAITIWPMMVKTFTTFLTKYQTDEPVIPFIGKDLAVLMKSLLKRFIKAEILNDITALQMVKLDTTAKEARAGLKAVDIGLGAEVVLKELQSSPKSSVGELSVLAFRKDCMDCLTNIVKKMQDKSPLKYTIVRQMACLDPTSMFSDPDLCYERMKGVVQRFLHDNQLSGGASAGDVIVQQFGNFLSLEAKHESFSSFQPMRTRLDVFLHGLLHQSYPELWAFCRKLLLLSHGQATVERGFSVNKEVEADNMKEDTVVAQRMICDYVSVCGGVLKVPLTKELLAAAASARSQYRLHLDQEKRKHASNAQREKRKGAEDHLEQLKTKKILIEVANSLEKDADKLAEQAEGKSGTLMAQLITKSNILRRRHKEKLTELKEVEKELEDKSAELRHMP